MRPHLLRERVAFDFPTQAQDGYGGTESGWSAAPQSYECRAEFIYSRGSEAVEAARLTGQSVYKLKIRQCRAARQIDASWRVRDLRRGTIYNIRESDSITDQQWIYVLIEGGVAV